MEQLVAWLHEEADDYGVADSAARCNRVAALLQQQAATIADLEAVIAGHEGEALLAITPADVPAPTNNLAPAPVEEALQRLLQWGGPPGCIGYSSEVVMGVVNWANDGGVGPLPPLPKPLRLREAAAPARPTPVDLAALHDPTFSDGLTAAKHRDVLNDG